MENANQEIIKEALNRLEKLTEKYQLNPRIKKYFKEGKLYYSYLTAGGLMGSIDTISHDARYEKAVKDYSRIILHRILLILYSRIILSLQILYCLNIMVF